MSCSIYCLVSGNEQLDSLMKSLERAGFAREHVTVVWRPPAARRPHGMPWFVSFTPVVWWWLSVTSSSGGHAASPGDPPTTEQVIVPYAMLKARRLRGRNA